MRYMRFLIVCFLFIGIFLNTYQLYHTEKQIKSLEQIIVTDTNLRALMREHGSAQTRGLEALKNDLIEQIRMIIQEYKNDRRRIN